MHHNPALQRFPDEAAIVGRMVVGFGELEYMFCNIAGQAMLNPQLILRTLYHLRSTSARIGGANDLMEQACFTENLLPEQGITFAAINHCLRIRNQYAHCNWADHQNGGLFFADLENSADREHWSHDWKHIDVPLLNAQEAYFGYARQWLFYLEHELLFRSGGIRNQPIPRPQEQDQPPPHNLASQHVPPWLGEDEQARHLARALEAERPPSQPVRQPSVLRLTREEWLAKCRRETREGRPPVCE